MLFRGTIAATAGTKMSGDYPWAVAPYPRRIRGICLTGGSAAGDTVVEVKSGQIKIAQLYNLHTDDVPEKMDYIACGLYVPGNVPIYAAVGATAAGSGSVYLHLDIVPSRIPIIGGEVFMKTVAAATAAVNWDALDDESIKSHTVNRILKAVALTGSAATGDTIIEISVGNTLVSELYNSNLGLGMTSTLDHLPLSQFVAAGKEMEFKVIDAASTNAIMLLVVMSGVARRSRGFSR